MTRLQEIREREKWATTGPWELWAGCSWRRFGVADQSRTVIEPIVAQTDGHPDLIVSEYDAEFVVHARSDIPYLLAELEKARELLQRWSDDSTVLAFAALVTRTLLADTDAFLEDE